MIQIIDYIIASIKHKKTTLTQKTLQSSDVNNVEFTVDSKIWEVMVSVSSESPEFRVIAPDATEVPLEVVTSTPSSRVAKLETKPGLYRVILNNASSRKPTSVIVTGSTSVTFQHGFSTFKPSTINETSTRPIPDQPSILSIELDNNNRDVILKTVQLRDENDNLIKELLLKMVNEKSQFYVTEEFEPPNVTFKIWINGETPTGEKIRRVAATTVEYQKPELIAETTKSMPPKVTILEESTVYAEFDKPLTVYCKVTGYPKPEISWQDATGSELPSMVNAVELPYEYVSVLDIAKIWKNETVTCKASNALGHDSSAINIALLNYLNVLQYPTDTTIEYGATEHMELKFDAFPPAEITWHKGDEILDNDENYQISEDRLTLTIKKMVPKLAGSYGVIVHNDNGLEQYEFNVIISGLEAPVIDKTVNDYHTVNGASVDLSCRVLSGRPEPMFYWSFNKNFDYDLFKDLPNGSQYIYHIERVTPEDSGVYRCLSRNDIGEDVHEIFLFVEYPPVVEMDDTHKIVKEGELIQLPCYVKGEPNPSVRWLVNGLAIAETNQYKIYRDNTLSFRGTVNDAGTYTCEATNPLGSSRRDVRLDIFVPVKIESPKQSIIELKVGNRLMLPCEADGYPQPEISWTYFSKNPLIKPRILEKEARNSFVLNNVQIHDEGLYTCVATNTESVANITYEVNVRAAPVITNTKDNLFKAVKGDLVLRIPCKVTGNPKPIVTWQFANGLNIITGSELYQVEEDGTLIIMNIDEKDANRYVCLAENSLGATSKTFEVIVDDAPTTDTKKEVVLLEEGHSLRIDCGIPHIKSFLIRWFKDGRNMNISDLVINNAQISDTGFYSCRVSNFEKSLSSHTKVIVGYKPRFTYEDDTDIDFSEGSITVLSCKAEGQPEPWVSWWKNNQAIVETNMDLILVMKPSDIGQYTCAVNNEFGTIYRTFNILSRKECVLNTNNDFKTHQPLLLSPELTSLRSDNGILSIQASHNILMICPNTFINIDGIKFGEHLNGTCVDGSIFNINGNPVDITNIRCNDKIVPLTKSTTIRCGPGNTKLLNIGYSVGFEFIGIYDVCIETRRKRPLYAKHEMHPLAANAVPNEAIDYVESRYLPYKFEDMYNCREQRDNILSLTGKRLSTNHKCCFAKRQLVNPKDVILGYQQVATYSYLNVIPKWGTCGAENWDDVEERIRNLVKVLDHPLEIYTGSSHLMKLPAQPIESTVHLTDRFGRKQMVPRYIWKVIIDHYEGNQPVAIVQINIPDITVYQAFSFMLCKDICHEIEWMRNADWRNVKKGFTFCCNIKEFEAKFGYKDAFKTRELNSKVLLI
ncbi:hemicentin-1 isoform X2 [Bicyclus anynana]|uniref:Hemicentin-1 isoform X2 n=1 Tax=Bicyclus anynana TaxID=110368 RepID=A0ABM3M0B1_BICAN|nr:hemicentin-1 isoform X2 [Bicyclus anynana]